jgi:hypothetical protein
VERPRYRAISRLEKASLLPDAHLPLFLGQQREDLHEEQIALDCLGAPALGWQIGHRSHALSPVQGLLLQAQRRAPKPRRRCMAYRDPCVPAQLLDRSQPALVLEDPTARFFEDLGDHDVISQGRELPAEPGRQRAKDLLQAIVERMPSLIDEECPCCGSHGCRRHAVL